jgi:hypothetical protein
MNEYIFITPETLTYKPNYDSPDPDFMDLHVFGLNRNATVQDTLQDLMELNEIAIGRLSNRPYSQRAAGNSRRFFWQRERRDKNPLAS